MVQHTSSKRDALLDILRGYTQLDSPIVDRSALGFIAGQEPPKIKSTVIMWAIAVPFLVLLTAIFVSTFKYYSGSPLLVATVISLIVTIFASIVYITYLRQNEFNALVASLQEPLSELKELEEYLTDYITGLDNRTSRYFHCVTNTKVTAYFVLTQINAALNLRIKEISSLLIEPTKENVLAAFKSLRGFLSFSDGVVADVGNMHSVPLTRLNATISQLIDNLEAGLAELEHELQGIQQPYRHDE